MSTADKLKLLESKLETTSSTERVDILFELAKEYLPSNPGKTVKYANSALNSSQEMNDLGRCAIACKYLGNGNNILGNYDQSLVNFSQALEFNSQLNNLHGISASLNNIAVTYSMLGNNEKALEFYLKALDIFEEINHTKGIAACISNIGILYKKFGELEKALFYYEKSLNVAKDAKNEYVVAAALNNIGEIYNMKQESDLALDYFTKSKVIAESIDNFELQININNNLGVIYLFNEDYSEAINVLLDSFRLSNEISKVDGMVSSLINIAKCYAHLEDFKAALNNINEARELSGKLPEIPELMLELYSAYTDIYFKMGKYKNAFEFQKKYYELGTKLSSETARKNMAELHTKYESDKKEKEAELFRLKNIELKLKNDELLRLNTTRNKFFSIIAHDLKNPFHALLGMLRYFTTHIANLEPYEISDISSQLLQSSEQVNNLLENLLDWARVQTGDIIPIPTHFDISGLVNENIKLLKVMAERKQIAIKNMIIEDITVFADQRMINSVIQNCITNSIKFTEHDGQINVKCKLLKNIVEIEIQDDGVGISRDKIKKLFKEEENIHTSGTENEKGTGLGLLLSKEFVEKNHGSIWIESEVGVGTSIFFTIPLA